MLDLSAAASAISLSQWVFALVGLALTAAWFFAPQLHAFRCRPMAAPEWTDSPTDTLLVVWVAVCGAFVGSLLAGSFSRQLGLPATDGWVSVLSVLGFQGAVVAALAGFGLYRKSVGRALPPIGAAPPLPATDRILLGGAVFCVALPFIYTGSYASTALMQALDLPIKLQDLANLFTTTSSPALLLGLTVMGVVVAPLGEEVIFRAGVFRIARRYLPRWAALLLSALAFASLHLSAVHFVPLTLLGIIFALAYERSGSLLVPVVAHGLFNLNTIVMLLAGVGGGP